MKKFLFIVALLWGMPALASNIYFAQSSAGGNTGADCADARAVTSHGIGDDVPGNTLHLCGTFTLSAGTNGFFTMLGSGSSGNPITLRWETGAIVQAPYFGNGNGGIDLNGQSYWILDGGTNGIIQNTANGTGLTYQHASTLIWNSGNNNTIKNLTAGPCYVHTSGDSNGGSCYDVENYLASNITIGPGNTFTQYDVGIYVVFEGSQSNLVITGNSCSLGNQCIEMGPGNSGTNTFTNIRVDHNTYTTSGNWYDSGDHYHHNFFHPFTNHPAASIVGTLMAYDNVMSGSVTNSTSFIYLENNNGGSGGTMGSWQIFNNTFDKTDTPAASTGLFVAYSANGVLVNNTFLDAGNSSNPWPSINITASGWTVENNIESGSGYYVLNTAEGSYTSDRNIYYNASYNDPWQWGGCGGPCQYGSLSSWRTACSCDPNTIQSNPLLNSNLSIPTGSPAQSLGANLTSLGITALNSDITGASRPSTGFWDSGAYNAPAAPPSNTAPAPPPIVE